MTEPIEPTQYLGTLVANEEPATSHLTVNLVVICLGVIALAIIIGDIILAVLGKPLLPDSLVVIAATASGTVGGLLGSTRSKSTSQPPTS